MLLEKLRWLRYKIFKAWILLTLPVRYRFSHALRDAYSKTEKMIASPDGVDETLHRESVARAIAEFKAQKGIPIPDIYRPGEMWQNILDSVSTFANWRETHDEAALADSLRRFYRTDLVTSHSGDMYIWDLQKGEINLKLQVYMIIRRYKQFIASHPAIDTLNVNTTGIGQNIYVSYDNHNIMLKTIRHAHYLGRIKELGMVPKGGTIGEMGSGSGELAILARRLLPIGCYVCFDLPETLLVATYNVLMTLPGCRIGLYSDFVHSKKITRKDMEKYDIIMLPNWCIEWMDDDSFDLFVNITSMSEMSFPIIENYIKQIERITRKYFYTVNRDGRTISQWGASEVPISRYPFSPGVKEVSRWYDTASDIYHPRYGLDYVSNYWEVVFQIP